MTEARVIVVLTMVKGGLYRTQKFKKPTYVGDPINAVRIFNDKEVDELVVVDIETVDCWSEESFKVACELADEAFMPLGYGGKVRTMEQVDRVFRSGFEKVIIGKACFEDPTFVRKVVEKYGSQSVVGAIDMKKSIFGKSRSVYVDSGRRSVGKTPEEAAIMFEDLGVGEIKLMSIDRDGSMLGFDWEGAGRVQDAVGVPLIVSGGAGNYEHLHEVVSKTSIRAMAAGSMFVFEGPHRSVLLQYPDPEELRKWVPRIYIENE